MPIRLIDRELLSAVSAEAQSLPRKRKNRNFHVSDRDACHRLLNAIEPHSYVMPHRHLDAGKEETMIVLAGKLGLVIFDDNGAVLSTRILHAGGDCAGVNIEAGTWHSVLGLVSGTVFFEAKAGPYVPLSDDERGAWAPSENDAGAADYYRQLRDLFPAG